MRKIMERFKAGEKLTENDRMSLAYGCNYRGSELDDDYKEVATEEGEDSRWTRDMDTIFKLGEDEYWCIPWRKGLTEYQEDEFWDDPYRVKKVVETIQVETWEAIPNAN